MLATRCDGVVDIVGVKLLVRDGNRVSSDGDDVVATAEAVFDLCCSADSVDVQPTTSDVSRRVGMTT